MKHKASYRTIGRSVQKNTNLRETIARAEFFGQIDTDIPCAPADKMSLLERTSSTFEEIYRWAVDHLTPQKAKAMAKIPLSSASTELSRTAATDNGYGVIAVKVSLTCYTPALNEWTEDEKADFLHRVQESMTETYQWLVENTEATEPGKA